MSKLTIKQKKFCDRYIKSGNVKDIAIKAGYSPKTAYSAGNENLNRPGLKFYVEEQMKKSGSKKTIGAKEVLEYLNSVMWGEQIESVAAVKGVYDDVPVSVKDGVPAAKEVLGRYPTDPLGKAQLRRANADAGVAEARARAVENNGQDIERLLNKMLVSLDKVDDRNSDN